MKDLKWLANRLKAMSLPEIGWRVQQKMLAKTEYRNYYCRHLPVWSFYRESLNTDRLEKSSSALTCILTEDEKATLFVNLKLLGDYSYEQYRTSWNAGFQTKNNWPEDVFSPEIKISQREDIGDIRCNWELNRHLQFAGLAKNYCMTGKTSYLKELRYLFDDWNQHNFFLHGVSWSSAMEIAIRNISWIYTYLFLTKAKQTYPDLAEEGDYLHQHLREGIWVMTGYLLKHRSRFSSANNHLIIELASIAIAGYIFEQEQWVAVAVKELSKELPRQNSSDGVNKEMSLHYQAFVMEAYGLVGMCMIRKGKELPDLWKEYLHKMSCFLQACTGKYGEIISFGDDDEGCILDFTGEKKTYYHYVLQLMGLILDWRYTTEALCETLRWISPPVMQEDYEKKTVHLIADVSHFSKGGYTILRSRDGKVLLGIDHAELGFGSIAAHGHADALSFQLYYGGKAVFLDPGTGNYHVPSRLRNMVRSEKNHNTLWVPQSPQAEMLGPFLWGKRYQLLSCHLDEDANKIQLVASIRHADGLIHERTLTFDFNRTVKIEDRVSDEQAEAYQCYSLPGKDDFRKMTGLNGENWEEISYSNAYDHMETAYCCRMPLKNGSLTTIFHIG